MCPAQGEQRDRTASDRSGPRRTRLGRPISTSTPPRPTCRGSREAAQTAERRRRGMRSRSRISVGFCGIRSDGSAHEDASKTVRPRPISVHGTLVEGSTNVAQSAGLLRAGAPAIRSHRLEHGRVRSGHNENVRRNASGDAQLPPGMLRGRTSPRKPRDL